MAKPKNQEEQKIYEELLEKYKDNKSAMEVIRGKYNNPTFKEGWKETAEILDWLEG